VAIDGGKILKGRKEVIGEVGGEVGGDEGIGE
jgi:hypothetical protein